MSTPTAPGTADPPGPAGPPGTGSGTTGTADPGASSPAPAASDPRGRDRLLDVVRAVAIVRVVAWHTWSWWWLSWIPAMPAMFFTTGALLEGSLDRHGWRATLRSRLRRLVLPFWGAA